MVKCVTQKRNLQYNILVTFMTRFLLDIFYILYSNLIKDFNIFGYKKSGFVANRVRSFLGRQSRNNSLQKSQPISKSIKMVFQVASPSAHAPCLFFCRSFDAGGVIFSSPIAQSFPCCLPLVCADCLDDLQHAPLRAELGLG